MILLSGEKISADIIKKLHSQTVLLKNKGITPCLAVILVGKSRVSKIYISEKEKACKRAGIKMKKYFLDANTTESELIKLIDRLNNDPKVTAILVQLPLPKEYDTDKVLNRILPVKDVDGLGSNPFVSAPTALAIMEIFDEYKINLKNKKICLIGYGRLVGRPLAQIFKEKKLDYIVCTSKTKNLTQKTKSADIVISATGKSGLITSEMIKKNTIIIDAGTSEEKSKISGDVDFEAVKNKVSYITPIRGGIGPITVAKLLENIVRLVKISLKKGTI